MMTAYQPIYHSGVKGQKWGVRRYQNPDGSLTSAGRQRYGVGERTKIRFQGYIRKHHQPILNTIRAKGVGNKMSELAGYGRLRTIHRINATTEKKLANASRTRLGKAIHNQKSANNIHSMKYAESMKSKNIGQKVVERMTGAEAFKTPYTRLSGRTTTLGERIVDQVLTGGMVGLAKDVGYMRNKKKANAST